MDIVRIIETYCDENNIEFRYGSKEHLNLLGGEIDPTKIYLLLFPVKRDSRTGSLGLSIRNTSYSGNFYLVVTSDYSLHYFNEKEQDESTSKYTVNIEPLLTAFKDLGNSLSCDELNINKWSNVDATDVLDANKDGLWCTYSIERIK